MEQKINKSKNQINVIYPYRTEGGTWVYDDKDLEVFAEAFVCGSSELIDMLVGKDCNQFTAYISAKKIPNHTVKLINVDKEVAQEEILEDTLIEEFDKMATEGEFYEPKGWYEMEGTGHRNWFCGHLLDYFEGYPKEIYVQIVKNEN